MGVRAFEQLRAERVVTPWIRTPVIVRNLTAETIDREWLHQRLGFKLGKFPASIDGTDVSLADESGPAGAPLFRATVQLRGAQDAAMTVTARRESARTAPPSIRYGRSDGSSVVRLRKRRWTVMHCRTQTT